MHHIRTVQYVMLQNLAELAAGTLKMKRLLQGVGSMSRVIFAFEIMRKYLKRFAYTVLW